MTKPGNTFSVLFEFILTAIAFVYILTIHEVSHGYTAYLFGDPTAKLRGRLTLNPLKHIEPIGLLMLYVVKIGWAKPIPVDPRRMRHRNIALPLVALAGPLSNVVFAFVIFVILKSYMGNDVFRVFLSSGNSAVLMSAGWSSIAVSIFSVMYTAFYINILLASFNLIPIPPLDGSKILRAFLPESGKRLIDSMERFGFIIILLLYYMGYLQPIIWKVFNFLINNIFVSMI